MTCVNLTNVKLTHTGSGFGYLASIEPLSGANYGQWREKIEIGLALHDMDLALTSDPPKEPVEPVRETGETDEAFATRTGTYTTELLQYDLDKAKWDQSNHKCLMVIKGSITDAIRGSIPECKTAKEYLEKIGSQYTGSSKAYAALSLRSLSLHDTLLAVV